MIITHEKSGTGTTKAFVASWSAMTTGADGDPIGFSQYTDKSIQVTGVFGSATLILEGSNNGIDYATLTDPQGNPLNFTSAKIEMVTEATRFVRPRVSGGDGSTSINVHMLLKE